MCISKRLSLSPFLPSPPTPAPALLRAPELQLLLVRDDLPLAHHLDRVELPVLPVLDLRATARRSPEDGGGSRIGRVSGLEHGSDGSQERLDQTRLRVTTPSSRDNPRSDVLRVESCPLPPAVRDSVPCRSPLAARQSY